MTTSIREQITASVFSLLQSTTGVGGRVYRSRVGSGQAFGVVQQQGIGYANIHRIGVMTSAAFVRRIHANEYAAILAATEQNAQVAELVAELLESPYVALDDPRLAPGLELLVAGGLLAPERVAQLLDFGIPERPPTAIALGQEWTSPTGTLYRVAQATDEDGQFLPDDPATPPRESLRWVVVEP